MHSILIRYQFHDSASPPIPELHRILVHTYGGAIQFIAEGTILIDTLDSSDTVFALLRSLFNFDDRFFVAEVEEMRSLHQITRTKPSVHRIAI